MEGEVNRQAPKASQAERESAWRDRLRRHASSDRSVVAFCQSESVSTASFYGWRSKLLAKDVRSAEGERTSPGPSPFIDLGPINADQSPATHTAGPNGPIHAKKKSSVEVRIDLCDGVLLTITRH